MTRTVNTRPWTGRTQAQDPAWVASALRYWKTRLAQEPRSKAVRKQVAQFEAWAREEA